MDPRIGFNQGGEWAKETSRDTMESFKASFFSRLPPALVITNGNGGNMRGVDERKREREKHVDEERAISRLEDSLKRSRFLSFLSFSFFDSEREKRNRKAWEAWKR